MKKGIQLVALLLTVVMSSCTGGKDKAAVKQEDEKPRVKVADVTARPVDQIQDYTATVEAEVKNNIAPSSPVRIDRILVECSRLLKSVAVTLALRLTAMRTDALLSMKRAT